LRLAPRPGQGESTPQRKAPLDSLGLEPDERVALSTHRACLLLAGTKLLQHSSGAQPRSLQPPQQGAALGVVVRTAFQSSQGALMRTILFSSQRATGNTKEVLVFVPFLPAATLTPTLTLPLTPTPTPN
jgi:cation-transporting ATPase 13A1